MCLKDVNTNVVPGSRSTNQSWHHHLTPRQPHHFTNPSPPCTIFHQEDHTAGQEIRDLDGTPLLE
jgi:hypothetical protein